MTKWVATYYKTIPLLEAAIEAIDNTVTIQVVEDKEGGFLLIQTA